MLWASDYPHWDSEWPNAARTFLARNDVSEADKRTILGDNPQRFYGFTVDVPAPAGSV
jgi:predicted TIM-barrel fold metal-dependent hydrolase